MEKGERAGLTTTVPVEVILAAGLVPVDLNNLFISSPDRMKMTAQAEARGFPRNLCAWIKGLYSAARQAGITKVVGVTRGDCSSTEKLLEVWEREGVETLPFSFPRRQDREEMAREIESLARSVAADVSAAEEERARLRPVRAMLEELDRMTWQEDKITGWENHHWLVSSTDFRGNPDSFRWNLAGFIEKARSRKPADHKIRLAYAGVPPIVDDLYDFLEKRGARVVLNEVQRQFSMPGDHPDLASQYTAYTYPYTTMGRIADIRAEIQRRGIQGVIHYAQTFCHRQIEAILMSEELPVPVLTIEADQPGPLDPRTMTRIEAFLEQLEA